MQEYYFTFSQGHRDIHGRAMHNCYVVVVAPDYGEARDYFRKDFALPEMGNESKWAF